jgi:AraC family ethanolamine operon transcriptional activator
MESAVYPVIFHSLIFRDAEHCASLFQSWDLQLRQLQPAPFQGKFFRWQTQELAISRFSNNCRVEIIGAKSPTAFVFANVIEPQDHSNLAHGTPLYPNCIGGFDPWREVNLVSAETGMDLLIVEVDRALLRSLADQVGRHDLDDAFFRQNLIAVDPVSMAAYRDYLKQIVYLVDHQPDFLQSPETIRLLKGSLLPLLINALRQPGKSPKPLRRADIVAAAQAYMDANLHRPITLAELSAAVCTSRRSLIYGFQDIFGMGPMTYLKQQRLHGVRRALLMADPEHETVANIARTWGFYGLGHFARDYKALFGEAPSETLRQDA